MSAATLADSRTIVGMRVDAGTYDTACERILAWARAGESRSVCIGTVHMVMEAHDDPTFAEVVNGADMVTSDGMPLVWGLRALGVRWAERVYGPDLTPILCRAAAEEGIPVGFYGGRPEVLARMVQALRSRFPGLEVAYAGSPPFGVPLEDLDADAEAVAASGARMVFVGIGCPRQERLIARWRGRVPAVLIGVGAAFDFLAGAKPQAPRWMQRAGLEWAFRLATEPRRLWRRYLVHNPRFVWHFGRQLLRERLRGGAA